MQMVTLYPQSGHRGMDGGAQRSFLPLSSVLDSSHEMRYPHSEWTFLTLLHLSGSIPRNISRSVFSREF